ncbi:hypothetical protein [Croceiramulus getboli]|nr:hypothetical protein P8624_03965 [Flavobacteriaceae bacterium YJPT1-3]
MLKDKSSFRDRFKKWRENSDFRIALAGADYFVPVMDYAFLPLIKAVAKSDIFLCNFATQSIP